MVESQDSTKMQLPALVSKITLHIPFESGSVGSSGSVAMWWNDMLRTYSTEEFDDFSRIAQKVVNATRLQRFYSRKLLCSGFLFARHDEGRGLKVAVVSEVFGAHTHTRTCIYIYTHLYTYIYKHMLHSHTHINAYVYIHTCLHTYIHTYTHIYKHTYMFTCTGAHTYRRTDM